MTDQYPFIPPTELVEEWLGAFFGCTPNPELSASERFLANKAAQWGYQQAVEELEAFLRKGHDKS